MTACFQTCETYPQTVVHARSSLHDRVGIGALSHHLSMTFERLRAPTLQIQYTVRATFWCGKKNLLMCDKKTHQKLRNVFSGNICLTGAHLKEAKEQEKDLNYCMLPMFSLWYRKETPGLAWTCVILTLVRPKEPSLKVVRKMRDVFWKGTTSGNSQARRKRDARRLGWDVCQESIILSFSWTNCAIFLTFWHFEPAGNPRRLPSRRTRM